MMLEPDINMLLTPEENMEVEGDHKEQEEYKADIRD